MPGEKGIYDDAEEPDEADTPRPPQSADDVDLEKDTDDVMLPDDGAEPTS